MYNLTIALRNRIRDYLVASTYTTQIYTANTDPAIVHVSNSHNFNVWWAMKNKPEIFIRESITKQVYNCEIKDVNIDTNTITLNAPIDATLNVGTLIKRAPNYEEIKCVLIGDPDVIDDYPAICISPGNKAIEWQVLLGTKETFHFNIITHVKEDNQENSTLTLLRITQDLEDLLNADLHLKVTREDYPDQYNRVYNSLVNSVEYGFSVKNEFLKSSKMAWFGDEFWMKYFLADNNRTRTF